MSRQTYISNVHPANSMHAVKKARLDIETANHRAVVSQVFDSIDGNWYNARRLHNARNSFAQQAITAINAMNRASCHVQEADDMKLLAEAREYLIGVYNGEFGYRSPIALELDINSKPNGEKYYDEMVVVTKALQRAHEYAKDFSPTIPGLIAGIHASCLTLLSPPESVAGFYDINTEIDDRFVDQPHTPRPANWPKRKPNGGF